jgi:hypothetical protein
MPLGCKCWECFAPFLPYGTAWHVGGRCLTNTDNVGCKADLVALGVRGWKAVYELCTSESCNKYCSRCNCSSGDSELVTAW